MADGGIFAIRDGAGTDLQLAWHGWLLEDGRPTRSGPAFWKSVGREDPRGVAAEGAREER
jgi:hypothetical protein